MPAQRDAVLARHALIGAVVGILVLHPVASTIFWFELHPDASTHAETFWGFAARRTIAAFTPNMLPMTGAFAVVGAIGGLSIGFYLRRLIARRRAEDSSVTMRDADVPTLLRAGEGERVEFKESARWDVKLGRLNTELERIVAKTIAGFMNHRGGVLLLGVTDAGEIVGLQPDYGTLKRKDRDGFAQFITSLVRDKLGGDVCPLVHTAFASSDEREVCRIAVEPAERPVYFEDGSTARYFLRMGNSTRELDVREAVLHIADRWPPGGERVRHPEASSP